MKKPTNWQWHAESFLAEWGDYQCTGSYTAKRILWSEDGDHHDEARSVIVEARWSKGSTRSTATLKYMGLSRTLWRVRARSVAEAIRKHERRVRKFTRGLIRAAFRMVYRRGNWGCVFDPAGNPIASIYRWDWNLRHAFDLFGSEFVEAFRNFNGEFEIWRLRGCVGSWSGEGMRPSPQYAYWIAA